MSVPTIPPTPGPTLQPIAPPTIDTTPPAPTPPPTGVLDLCEGVTCPAGQSCNPSDGTCLVPENTGTDFILSFLQNIEPPSVELHVTSVNTTTSVVVEYPVGTIFLPSVMVDPDNITIITLPSQAAQAWVPGSGNTNSVRVRAADDFFVYMINRLGFTSDAALALPVVALNTEYIVVDYNGFPGLDLAAIFVVTAVFDGTVVTITPTNDIFGHRALDGAFSVTLDFGESYYARATLSGPVSLTGSTIVASQRVTVTNGVVCTQVPSGVAACDHLFQVAQPVQTWGRSIAVANLPQRPSGSVYRIVAAEDDTSVTQDGASLVTLNKGEFFETAQLPGNYLLEGDKPIFVVQFMTGSESTGSGGLGDPAMGNMIPTDQFLNEYTFSTVGGSQFRTNYVTVIADDRDVAMGTVTLDGVPVASSEFSSIGSSGLSTATLLLVEGVHATESQTAGHGIYVMGLNSFDSYLYPGGAKIATLTPP